MTIKEIRCVISHGNDIEIATCIAFNSVNKWDTITPFLIGLYKNHYKLVQIINLYQGCRALPFALARLSCSLTSFLRWLAPLATPLSSIC